MLSVVEVLCLDFSDRSNKSGFKVFLDPLLDRGWSILEHDFASLWRTIQTQADQVVFRDNLDDYLVVIATAVVVVRGGNTALG